MNISTKNGCTRVGRAAETNDRTARLKCLALLSMVCLITGHAAHGVARDPAAKESRSVGRENERARSVSVRAYALPGGEAASRSAGPGILSTGFEPGEGFATGAIHGQAGWSAFTTTASEGHIDTINPAAGSQHLRISKDPSLPTETNTGAFSPDLGPLATGPSTTSVDVAISATGGAVYFVAGQSPSQGFLTWEVAFGFAGQIFVLDDIGGDGDFELINTGTSWAVSPYQNLTVCDDPVAGTTAYFYNGALIYSQVTHVTGTRVEQVVFVSNNFQGNDDGDFDNLSVQSGLSGPCAPGGGFNIDLNAPGGSVPPDTSGAVAVQPGAWNDISFLGFPPNNQLLVDLGGNLTSVGIETDVNWQMGSVGAGVTWNPDLMNDHGLFTQPQSTITVTDLPSGTYDIYVYSFSAGGLVEDLSITIGGATKTVQGPGFDPGGQVQGQTFEVFAGVAHPGGNLPILLGRATSSVGLVNGLQITTAAVGTTGGCCDRATGICTDNVLEEDCIGTPRERLGMPEEKSVKRDDCDAAISNELDPATCTLTVDNEGVINDVDVDLLIAHTWRGDLTIVLSHGGVDVVLYDGPNTKVGISDNLGDPATGAKLIFDDEAAIGLDQEGDAGDSPTGLFQPLEALSAFDGMDKNGEWTLTVTDNFKGDEGTLINFGLSFDYFGNPCPSGDCEWFPGQPCSEVSCGCQSDDQCDDGLFCNGEELCVDSICQPGTPPNCDDGIGCTVDSCDEAGDQCVNTPDDSVCDDGNPCTIDSCNPGTGECVNEPDEGCEPKTFKFECGLLIPDNDLSGVRCEGSVPDDGTTIANLDVELFITHTWQGDLEVILEHKDTGTTVELINRVGADPVCPGEDFGYSADNFGTAGNKLLLDDDAPTPINPYDGCPPEGGRRGAGRKAGDGDSVLRIADRRDGPPVTRGGQRPVVPFPRGGATGSLRAGAGGFAINPALDSERLSRQGLPTLQELMSRADTTGSIFSGGNPPTQLDIGKMWFFNDEAPFNLVVRDFDYDLIPAVSSWDLGLGDISDFNLLFGPFFELHPEAFIVQAWHTSGGKVPPSLSSSTSTPDALPRDLFPLDTLGDLIEFDTMVTGVPNIGDGVLGWIISGTVSTAGGTGIDNFAGPAQPEEPLSIFDGEPKGGDWSLTVIDHAADDIGTLENFSLIFTNTRPIQSDVEPGPTSQPCNTPCAEGGCKDCEAGAEALNSVHGFSGEFNDRPMDLQIAGRKLDFVWCRKYRSKIGPDTAMGNGWDFGSNIWIEPNGPDMILHDGNTRADTYSLQPDGTWTRREFFRELEENDDGSLTMTFADTGTWEFHPLDGSPQQGKIKSIVDRNGNGQTANIGNELTFEYDSLGKLVKIHDTLDTAAHNRDIIIAYNTDGFIESVTDFTGRQVTYEYYDGVEPGGSFGDLKSVRTPTVTGTPNGNDFPDGKTTTYTYSTGFDDERLNGNLLTITDPKGQTYLTNTYAATEDPNDLNYDRVVRQNWGDPGDNIDIVYASQTPSAGNNFAVTKATVNDRVGNVKEYFYDAGNRMVMSREYTGRADPDLPTDLDLNINPPVNPLRLDDPAFFETRYEWNDDSLKTGIVHPNLNKEVYVYDEANPSRRSQGNMLEHTQLPGPLGGDQTEITESYEYDDEFGGCCGSNFVTKHTDARGNMTLHTYDDNGNRTHTQHRIASIVEDWEYNTFGQMTAHVLPDNGSSSRRRDEYTYYDGGIQTGYLKDEIVDAPGFALTSTYEYDSLGRTIRTIDPRRHDTQYVYNELDQTVRQISREVTEGGGVRYERDTFFDANDNVVRTDIQNKDDQGAPQPNSHFTYVYEYEILNYRIKGCEEVGDYRGSIPGPTNLPTCAGLPQDDFLSTEYVYDKNRNRILVRYGEAVEGRQPNNTGTTEYDERDLVIRETRAQGDPDQTTSQYDYDKNGNTRKTSQGIEDVAAPRVTQYSYDGYDRRWAPNDGAAVIDPMGNVAAYHYDHNSNVGGDRVTGIPNPFGTRRSGELFDVPGGVGNVRLTQMTSIYDEMDRVIRGEVEFFDTDTQTPIQGGQQLGKVIALTEYSDNSQVIRSINDNDHQTLIRYDTANRSSVVTDHKANTLTYTYDVNSNVTETTELDKSDLGNPDEAFTTTSVYDDLDRTIQTVDNVGNTHTYAYDSRDNRTLTDDALSHETRYVYDGINRLIKTVRDLDGDSDGDGIEADEDEPADIVTTQAWDDNSRLTAQTDDSGNATRYAYDPLDRPIVTQMADGTIHQVGSGTVWLLGQVRPDLGSFNSGYDVHHSELTSTDANASVITSIYDLNNRLTNKSIVPGPGVSDDTTLEIYEYDGLSRIVRAEDDDSVVTRSYDSLSRVARETLNGQTTTDLYDGVGNQLTCTYPGGRVITNTYDELERKKTISDSGGTIATYNYVGPGRVTRREYGNGTRTDYTYDGITGIPNPANDFGVKSIIGTKHTKITGGSIIDERTYAWDRMYNKTQRADVPGGPRLTHNYTYDSIYRLVHTTVTDGSPPLTVRDTEYDLDGVGNRTQVNGDECPGDYSMSSALPEPADSQLNQYTRTPAGSRAYDKNGNLIGIGGCTDDCDCDDGDGCTFDSCNPVDQVCEFTPRRCGDFNLDGMVDLLDILCVLDAFAGDFTNCCFSNVDIAGPNGSCGPDGQISLPDIIFVLDCFAGTDVCGCGIPPRDDPPSRSDASPAQDGDPDSASACPASLAAIRYDYRNQMVEYTDADTNQRHTYAYDPFGRRIVRVVDADGLGPDSPTETRYFYHGWQVLEEQDPANATQATYVYGLYIDEVLTMQRPSSGPLPVVTDHYYHTDDLYNVMAVTDADGSVAERYEYADYGQPLDSTTLTPIAGDPSTIGNPYGFTGRRYDPETAWYHYRTRYLDPVAGRFTTRDTLGIWRDMSGIGNGYTYGANNPVTLLDPYGTQAKKKKDECCLERFWKEKDEWTGAKKEQKKVEFRFKVKKGGDPKKCCLVNFLKGSYKDLKDGKFFTVAMFGNVVDFNFPNWSVDTLDADPVYASKGGTRWKYTKVADLTHKATDAPGPVLKGEKMSVDFKMCIFECKDVPENAAGVEALATKGTKAKKGKTGAQTLIGKATKCIDWSAKVTYKMDGTVTKP